MTFFVAAGIIADDVVRKETRAGVLAAFRLKTGAPNGRRLWIDVEAWGQLAGTVAHHGSAGRGVLVSGRLTYKTWRDRQSGESRNRYVVTAHDIDLLSSEADPLLLPATVVVAGTVDSVYPERPTPRGVVHSFRLSAGRAGVKTGRLWIDIEYWRPHDAERLVLIAHRHRVVSGSLDYRAPDCGQVGGLRVRATNLRGPDSTSGATHTTAYARPAVDHGPD